MDFVGLRRVVIIRYTRTLEIHMFNKTINERHKKKKPVTTAPKLHLRPHTRGHNKPIDRSLFLVKDPRQEPKLSLRSLLPTIDRFHIAYRISFHFLHRLPIPSSKIADFVSNFGQQKK